MRRVIAVGVGSLVVFALGVLATWLLLEARTRKLLPPGTPPAPPVATGAIKIGIVHQNLFEHAGADAELLLAPLRDRLGTYGWIDRAHGIIHIPIERAMELVAAGQAPPPVPTPAPTPGGP